MEIKQSPDIHEIITKTATEYTQLDGCLTYAHLNADLADMLNGIGEQAIRIEHSIFLLLVKGSINLTYNFEKYKVEAPSIVSFPPGTIVHIGVPDCNFIDAYILDYAPEFLQEVNISFNAISGEALLDRKSPGLELRETELSLILRYYSLMHSVLADNFNTQLTRHIVSNLSSAIFYQFVQFLYKRIDNTTTEGMGARRGNYVHDFIKLVHLYYTKERSVGFYASKLFISPKYLSLLVKEATGRSAARWIDQFVIMEAKNMLRYSGKNIQQVAYDLNFSNQSSFGKYFKHLTGMSPTEFQKS